MTQIKPLIPELQKVANEELGEIPTRIAEDLQALKEWLTQQPHLKSIDDDALLLQCLRGSKHSLERAKEKIDLWSAFPEKFVIPDVSDEKFQQFLKEKSLLALPIPLNDFGPRIIIARVNFNAKEYTPVEVIRYGLATLNVMIVNDPYACIYGCVYFLDLTDITTEHIFDYNLSFFKRLFIPVLRVTPIRFKGIYILNTPASVEHLVPIISTFLPDKISKRIKFCSKNMKEVVPQKYLPIEYGGENGSFEQLAKDQAIIFDEHREYLKRVFEYRSDERLRIGKSPIECEEQLGVDGSFRKLNVD